MNAAKIPFAMLQIFGIWQPKSWTSKLAIYSYGFYGFLIISAFAIFILTLFIYLLKFVEDLDSFTETLLVLSTFSAAGMKMMSIMVNRKKIIAFDDFFLETIFIPRDSEEAAIKKGFDDTDRMESISLLTICMAAILSATLSPLLSSAKEPLPCDKTWIPYSLEPRVSYWLTYIYQTTIFIIMNLITCSIDLVVAVTLQRICSQLDIFKHRLLLLPKLLEENSEKALESQCELKIMTDWIIYHSHIYSVGKKLNDIFSLMIFAQYFVTSLALCIVIYHLAKVKLFTAHFWFMFCGFNNYMIEIFVYCWFGEGMICKSIEIANAVYEMNWNMLTISSKKCLLIIMMRARRPMELIGASMVTMSVDTLVKIMKVSYSAFSVLRSSAD